MGNTQPNGQEEEYNEQNTSTEETSQNSSLPTIDEESTSKSARGRSRGSAIAAEDPTVAAAAAVAAYQQQQQSFAYPTGAATAATTQEQQAAIQQAAQAAAAAAVAAQMQYYPAGVPNYGNPYGNNIFLPQPTAEQVAQIQAQAAADAAVQQYQFALAQQYQYQMAAAAQAQIASQQQQQQQSQQPTNSTHGSAASTPHSTQQSPVQRSWGDTDASKQPPATSSSTATATATSATHTPHKKRHHDHHHSHHSHSHKKSRHTSSTPSKSHTTDQQSSSSHHRRKDSATSQKSETPSKMSTQDKNRSSLEKVSDDQQQQTTTQSPSKQQQSQSSSKKEKEKEKEKERGQSGDKADKEKDKDKGHDQNYPAVFNWSHGGRDVYVAYSGDNWSQKYRMHKSQQDFTLIMDVPHGVYHYKFIVDNAWRCAPDQNWIRDTNGAYSNVMEVRSSSQAALHEEKKRKARNRQQFAQEMPDAETYIQDPPVAPPQLGYILLNQKPERGHHPLILPKPSSVAINHLYVADKREEEVVTLGITERFRDKFITTVYYKPIDSRGEVKEYGNMENKIHENYVKI